VIGSAFDASELQPAALHNQGVFNIICVLRTDRAIVVEVSGLVDTEGMRMRKLC
jgi:hypothetical protein